MTYIIQGLMIGFAYVAPIGVQNLFVINTALTQRKQRVYLTALIIMFFDVTLSIGCFIVAWIGIDGVKALSNIGGIVALFIEFGIIASIVVLIIKWRKLDETGTYKKEAPELK